MLARLCLAAALMALGCGGTDGTPEFDAGAVAGSAGAVEQAGGSAGASAQGGSIAGAAQAGAGGIASGAGQGGAAAGGGGQPDSQGGGSISGGETTGGTLSAGGGGSGGKPTGGSGGQVGDPLEPKPVPGCPGYVKVLVPHGTCVWFHGTFTHQTETCSLMNPVEGTCGTASAVSKDIETIVSESAEITRFDFNATGCPKQCN